MLAQEARERLFRRVGARPAFGGADRFDARCDLGGQGDAAGAVPGADGGGGQSREGLPGQAGEVGGGAGLHPRGDLFAEEFEEKLSHDQLSPATQASQQALASVRTRPM